MARDEEKMLHCIVAGSRTFEDYGLMERKLDAFFANHKDGVEIVGGAARGADMLAQRYAFDRGLKIKEFPADWARNGRSAGFARNREMFEYASGFGNKACVVFWDGQSRGSKDDIELTGKYGVPIRIVRF